MKILNSGSTVRWFVLAGLLGTLPASQGITEEKRAVSLDFATVRRIVDRHFSERTPRRGGDLISRGDAQPLFDELADAGWSVADRSEILSEMLADQDFLVQTLRTPLGEKFMRQVSSDKQIYDRLDRISRVQGGQQLLRDLLKLPDAAKYAKSRPHRGVPNLLDLLPKTRNGKTRKIKDYDKPTDKIYTAADFVKRLEKSHLDARADSAGK